MARDHTKALQYGEKWIDIIKEKKKPDEKQSEWIISESLKNFAEHFNK